MKNLKTLLIPIGLIALVVGIFSFTNHENDDKKCTIKIVKMVNGIETVTDSTFDCDVNMDMTFMSTLNGLGDSLHKMMKVMMVDGEEGEFNFKMDFDENEENGMKVMKFTGSDGKEMEMKFNIQMDDEEKGNIKMMINGEEMEIKIDDLHKHLDKMHEHAGMMDNKTGNVEILIESDEEGKEPHTVKIIKTIDDDGKVTIKKIVDGKETELDAEAMKKMHKGHKMMFIGDDGKNGNHNVTIDVKVDDKDGKKGKHVVIITKVSNDNKATKRISGAAKTVDKKELEINKLKFSPNPNDGKFDLSFNLEKTAPVQIKIFDVQGKEVYNENIKEFSGKYNNNIDISGKGEGVYIMQIVQGNKASTNKIMIK